MKLKCIVTLFIVFMASGLQAQEYKDMLAGKRLILDGATCAGMAFKNKNTVLLYDEMFCSLPTDARVRWITNDFFLVTETERIQDECPPRNWLYKVKSIKGNRVQLLEIWTGWNDHKDVLLEYKNVSQK